MAAKGSNFSCPLGDVNETYFDLHDLPKNQINNLLFSCKSCKSNAKLKEQGYNWMIYFMNQQTRKYSCHCWKVLALRELEMRGDLSTNLGLSTFCVYTSCTMIANYFFDLT